LKPSVDGYMNDAKTLPEKYRALVLARLSSTGSVGTVKEESESRTRPSAPAATVQNTRGQLFVPSSDPETAENDQDSTASDNEAGSGASEESDGDGASEDSDGDGTSADGGDSNGSGASADGDSDDSDADEDTDSSGASDEDVGNTAEDDVQATWSQSSRG
jgi:hypothetical protein